MQAAEPCARMIRVAGPDNPLARECATPERVVVHHRPPEPHVPGEPPDARRTDVIVLAIRPIRAPFAVLRPMDVEPARGRTPEALLSREGLEVNARELPRGVELPRQNLSDVVGHQAGNGRSPGAPNVAFGSLFRQFQNHDIN